MISNSDGRQIKRYWKIVDLVRITIVNCVLKKETLGPLEDRRLSTQMRFSGGDVL